jgi:hypothetical protein
VVCLQNRKPSEAGCPHILVALHRPSLKPSA